jgi:hypothetical protein
MAMSTPPPNLSNNHEENHRLFFEEAVSTGCVWGLQHSDESWALSASEKHPDTNVMPFWSQPEYAQCHATDDWADHEVVAISLEEFLEDWLLGMHNDVVLVGINWDAELEGEEHEPLDVLDTFENEFLS